MGRKTINTAEIKKEKYRLYREKNKEKIREERKQYYQRHREEIRAKEGERYKARRFNEEWRKKRSEYAHKYYLANREKILAKVTKSYIATHVNYKPQVRHKYIIVETGEAFYSCQELANKLGCHPATIAYKWKNGEAVKDREKKKWHIKREY